MNYNPQLMKFLQTMIRVLSHYIKKEIENLSCVGDGNQLMKYLIMVGRADNKAQNPQMTAESLHLLDVMDKMLDNMQTQVTI